MNKRTSPLRLPYQRPVGNRDLLPLPREARDRFSLQYHLHLEALRAGCGSMLSLQLLMRVGLAAALLQQLGYGNKQDVAIEELEASAEQALDAGKPGHYSFSTGAFRQFAQLVTYYDQQLAHAPLKALTYVETKLAEYGSAR